MIRKKLMYIITLLLITLTFSFSQGTKEDKYTTINVMISKVYSTSKGLIIEYFSSGKKRQTYLPNKFFDEGIAVKVIAENTSMTPQMNIIYRNLEPYKVKIYLPRFFDSITYQVMGFMTKEHIEKFKVDKLIFVFKDEKTE